MSATNQSRSSRDLAAVLRPAPDMPVMITISGGGPASPPRASGLPTSASDCSVFRRLTTLPRPSPGRSPRCDAQGLPGHPPGRCTCRSPVHPTPARPAPAGPAPVRPAPVRQHRPARPIAAWREWSSRGAGRCRAAPRARPPTSGDFPSSRRRAGRPRRLHADDGQGSLARSFARSRDRIASVAWIHARLPLVAVR